MAYKIQLRRDTVANWTNFDPVLSAGEAGLEIDTGKLKFGDGSTAWTSLKYFFGNVIVDASDNIITAGDILPQSSINGLNARFKNLFGDDVPANPVDFVVSTWFVDDEANNKLGFETGTTANSDSYTPSTPFSKSNTGTVYFFTRNHHLIMRAASTNKAILQWTDSTAKQNFTLSGMVGFSVDDTSRLQEIRLWNVQSPGASDDYYGIRWLYNATAYPDWPYRIKLFTGTGTTFAATDGTEQVDAPFDPTARYWLNIKNATGSTRCLVTAKKYLYGDYGAREILDYGSGAFGGFQTVRFFVQSGFDPAIIDSIEVS